ncbi:MAG: hypothetical protein AB7V32_06780 [Candidatus Berkiella sp.]
MSSLIEKNLRNFGSDYLTASELAALLPIGENARHAQVKRALAQGNLIRLKRGIYRRAGYLEQSKPHPFEMSHYLLWPSYVSLESALSYHGLIPEAIYETTCVTSLRAQTIHNQFGNFVYHALPQKNFFIDVKRLDELGATFNIANPWKALCDYVYCYKKNWNSLEPVIESLRIDITLLPKLTNKLGCELTSFYKSKRVSLFLIGVLDER